MKILVVTPTFLPLMGGAEIGIYEIFHRLADRHRIQILTPHPDKSLIREYGMDEPDLDLSPLEVVRFKDRVNPMNWPGQWKLRGVIPPFSLSAVKATARMIREFDPELINFFYVLPLGLAAFIVDRIKKRPVVLSIIGRDIPGPEIPLFWRKYARMISRRVGIKIFISEYCRQAFGDSDLNTGDVVPFGVDLARYSPENDGSLVREKIGIPRNAKVLFAIQRLDRWKRVDIVIRAFQSVLKHVDAYLVIGGKGIEKDRLMQLSRELGVSSRVIFTGYIPERELPFYYAMADLFVFHSTFETLGLVLLQAMASGKAVVSVNSTAIPEVIDSGKNGLLVEPLKPEKFADAVLSLLKNSKQMERYGVNSREKVEKEFNWDSISNRYEEIFFKCQKSQETS